MMFLFRHAVTAAALFAVACGSPIDDKGKSVASNNTAANNVAPNNATANNVAPSNSTANNGGASCGDGVLNAGELCDPAVTEGAGACPVSCQAPACSTAALVGSNSECTAQCIVTPIACTHGDGCCPMGCDAASDNDCTNSCGDGVVEAPELCDGDCPSQCADQGACMTATLVGSAEACDAVCSVTAVTACSSADGCCPAGCTSTTDNDCVAVPTCGDGNLDPGELCDGNCPAACNDGLACTTDALTGAAATCNARCTSTPITVCSGGDGCCAPGCTFQNDSDCACVPRTCASANAECGSIADGCGGTVTCSDTCSGVEVCTQNRCAEENFIGQDCTDYPQCGSSTDAVCILPPGWPGGYCSLLCNSATNTSCPTGSHCTGFDGVNSVCTLDCTSSGQCDAGYDCRQFDGAGGLECVPTLPPPGVGDVGDACLTDIDCNGTLECLQSTTVQTVTTVFPGGVCTEACAPIIQPCQDVGAACGTDFLCMQACADSTDCRAGWTCQFGTPPLTLSHCWPS